MDKNTEIKFLLKAINSSLNASRAILEVYNENEIWIKKKSDKSPLTRADLFSNEEIFKVLNTTNIPILSEEGKEIKYADRKKWEYFWIVDPLDGTKEFIKKNGEFTINIALISKNSPVLGVVLIPVENKIYFASENTGSFLYQFNTDNNFNSFDFLLNHSENLKYSKPNEKFTIIGSRSHFDFRTSAFIKKYRKLHKNVDVITKGSSIKLCLLAEKKAQIYPRFSPTMEWDTAAGHAILKFSGGKIISNSTNQELEYNKENLLNPSFIAYSENVH